MGAGWGQQMIVAMVAVILFQEVQGGLHIGTRYIDGLPDHTKKLET